MKFLVQALRVCLALMIILKVRMVQITLEIVVLPILVQGHKVLGTIPAPDLRAHRATQDKVLATIPAPDLRVHQATQEVKVHQGILAVPDHKGHNLIIQVVQLPTRPVHPIPVVQAIPAHHLTPDLQHHTQGVQAHKDHTLEAQALQPATLVRDPTRTCLTLAAKDILQVDLIMDQDFLAAMDDYLHSQTENTFHQEIKIHRRPWQYQY